MRLPHRLQGQKVKSQGGAGAYCGGDLAAQLVLDPVGRLGGKVWSPCEEFEDSDDCIIYWVNVSESSGLLVPTCPG